MKKNFPLFIICLFALNAYSQKDYTLIYQTDSIIKKGVRFHDDKKYSEALKEYEKISQYDPEYLKAQSEIALTLSESGKKEDLKKLFENLYTSGKMKDYPELYIRYGSFLDDENELEKAEKVFKEAEKQLNNNSSYLYNYAVYLIKAKKTQQAIDTLERLITINPNYSSAHYLLGYLAFENGNCSEGALSMITYLVIAPNGRFAKEAINTLNKKFGENYLTKGKSVLSKSGDNFDELNEILINQFPLNKNYKLKASIDEVITRQVQAVVEYAKDHKMGNGFFETSYIPWMKEAVNNNQVEALDYYILISLETALGKKLTAQKKKIEGFQANFIKIFWDKMTQRNLDFYGKKEDVTLIYKDNYPFLIGKVVDDKKEGQFIYLNENGTKVGDLQFKNNELNGQQKYYNAEGKLIEEKNFKSGKIDGIRKTYFANGTLSSNENYSDDKLNGLVTTYFINGGKSGELNFLNDEKNGKIIFYFPNGSVKTEVNYVKNKFDGPVAEYNEVGDITIKGTYKDDLFEGDYKQFYNGKVVKAEGFYVKGKIKGSYKKYYSNGKLQSETVYENGKIRKEINYLPNGKLDEESFYSDDEDREKIVLYDAFGEKFFEEKFKNGDLKSGLQYFKNGEKPKEINLVKKSFEILNLDGTKFITGEFEKGKRTGEWTYFYSNGNIKTKQKYTDGRLNGLEYTYKKNGDLSVICNYVDDQLNGMYESYSNGKVSNVSYYVNDKRNGPSTTYSDENKIIKEQFFIDGDIYKDSFDYNYDGTLRSKTTYTDNSFTQYEIYDVKGKLETSFEYANKNGAFTIPFYDGVTKSNFILKNGQLNGKYEFVDKLNTPIIQSNYVNGSLHGIYKTYNPNGTIDNETIYYSGELNGEQKYYDLAGNLKMTYNTVFSNNTGKTTRYNANKTKLYEYSEIENSNEGEYKWFNSKGENIVSIFYENNIPLYYLRLDKQGELKDKVEIVNQTAEIVSTYTNGKKAFYLKLVKGNNEGQTLISSFDGQPEYSANYKKNSLEGERIEYYANGKIYKKEHFKEGDYDGLAEYFTQDGKKIITAEYKNDELNGKCQIFENGILKSTKTYRADELLQIK